MPRTDTLLAAFPRAILLGGPTPLERLDRLSAELDIDLWIKRDDLTGLSFGGNKTRQLEFYIGAARAAARQQESQACEAEFRFRVSRHESCNKCIGEAAVGGNRIDLGPNPLSHRSMHLPLGEYGLGCRLHTSGQ